MTPAQAKTLMAQLPILERETWDNGTEVVFRAVPFDSVRKPACPARLHATAFRECIPLSLVRATQKRVSESGVEKYLLRLGPGEDYPPLVYLRRDGTYAVADGHHRLVAAFLRGCEQVQVLVVRAP